MRVGTLVGIVVAIVLVAALWNVARLGRQPSRPAATPPEAPDTSDAVIEDALVQIPGADSIAIKTRWMDEIAGIDLAGLEGARLELFLRHANARACTCGCGYTLAACRTYDPTCPVSGPVVEALRDSVLDGHVRDAQGLRERRARSG